MTQRLRYAAIVVFGLVATAPAGPTADRLLAAAGFDGGLIGQLGCADTSLTAGLCRRGKFLVHGLDATPSVVERARAGLLQTGLYGQVSVEQFDGRSLPWADSVVNLLVVSDPQCRVPASELERVLVPGGALVLPSTQSTAMAGLVREPCELEGWERLRKPRPRELGEWTHFLQDAGNNAVAADTRVGPPRRLQWACGPAWARSHEYSSSLVAMVSAAGRLFYVFDEGVTGVTVKDLPDRWVLIARDAFNGLTLWRKPLDDFRGERWQNVSLRGVPASVQRLLVAQHDRLYVPLGLGRPVSMLNAATGEVLAVCAGTENAQELHCVDGVLLAHLGRDGLAAFDAETGAARWQHQANPWPKTLAAQDGRVLYADAAGISCLRLATGEALWRRKTGDGAAAKQGGRRRRAVELLVVHRGQVLVAGGDRLQALAADDGRQLWSVAGRLGGRGELFVAQGRAWHWEGDSFVGHDLATGKVSATVRPGDVFTPGHHLRCYPGKATENYIIAPYRGAEFISLTGGEHTENDWLRGPCAYGVLPCNGLLYAPPDPCFCYPGVKLLGFKALAPAAARPPESPGAGDVFKRGPAYEWAANHGRTPTDPQAWPTYRHDARRSGCISDDVAAAVQPRWQRELQAPLTPPVAAGGRVFVAEKDAFTLHALNAADGASAWHFVAGSRLDSPPSVCGELVLFGCTDGWLYCLRATDGVLAWRRRVAPAEERIVVRGRLESRWPVHGSVLPLSDLVYCTAGRSTYLDGGIHVLAVRPGTGEVVHQTTLDTWRRTREDAVGKPFVPAYHMEGSNSDILVSEGGAIFLGQYKLSPTLQVQDTPYILPEAGAAPKRGMDLRGQDFVSKDVAKTQALEEHQRQWLERAARDLVASLREKHGAFSLGHRQMGRHVFATSGFLDDSWFNRTYWMYTDSWPGFYLAHRAAKTGQLLVVGPARTYAVQAYPERNLQSPQFIPGGRGYLLFADRNDNEPLLSDETRETTKGWGFTRAAPPVWHQWVPIRVRGMVLTRRRLFVAGAPDVLDPGDPMAAFRGREGAVLRCCAADSGAVAGELQLRAPPVFDGLIAASGRLYLADTSGSVTCFQDSSATE